MTAWEIALSQLDKAIVRDSYKRCPICGDNFVVPTTHRMKMYCGKGCSTRANAMRQAMDRANARRAS